MSDTRIAVLAAAALLLAGSAAGAAEPTVVTLTQVGCQFLESENGVDHHYTPKTEEDCNKINAQSGACHASAWFRPQPVHVAVNVTGSPT